MRFLFVIQAWVSAVLQHAATQSKGQIPFLITDADTHVKDSYSDCASDVQSR
jgi:hypothetical protein